MIAINQAMVALFLCLFLVRSYAVENVHISGFGQVVAKSSLDNDKPYGMDDADINFKNESLFGLQFTANLADNLSATVQAIAVGMEDNDVEFQWAYLTYLIDNHWSFKFGKLRTPFFDYSEYIDVGYAYHWVRPPQVVYIPVFKNLDGIDLTFSHQIGQFESDFDFIWGQVSDTIPPGPVDLPWLVGFSERISWDKWSIGVSYFRAKMTLTPVFAPGIDAFVACLPGPPAPLAPSRGSVAGAMCEPSAPPGPTAPPRMVHPDFQDMASAIDIDREKGEFYGISLRYESESLLFVSEVTKSVIEDSIFTDPLSYYLTLGYSIGDWMPHITFEGFDVEPKTSILELYQSKSSHPLFDAKQLDMLTKIIQDTNQDKQIYTIGVRYDFHPSAAMKFDINWQDFENEVQPIQVDAKLLSFAIVFTF
ncbi:hypothetical protein [Algicola sagamiensis]|uniref:hypothetical protein n=1 Tax=Algicola sagamiensis TaxID=163869 RepID=UPI00039E797A|nr:hypothetical protein [Algicola sagamiensis]